jgi:hypothetical protein
MVVVCVNTAICSAQISPAMLEAVGGMAASGSVPPTLGLRVGSAGTTLTPFQLSRVTKASLSELGTNAAGSSEYATITREEPLSHGSGDLLQRKRKDLSFAKIVTARNLNDLHASSFSRRTG